MALYFWIENKTLVLRVTASELHYFDPTFTDCGWTVPVNEVLAIEQYTDLAQQYFYTNVILASGERKQLNYSNFAIGRSAFFSELKRANAAIKPPENPYSRTS